MQIKKLIKLLEVIDNKTDYNVSPMPSDMYELGSCLYEQSNGEFKYINDMDFVHVMRAFKKMQDTLAEEVRRDTQEGRAVSQDNQIFALEKRVSELLGEAQRLEKDSIDYVRRDVYEMLFDKCERLEKRIKSFYESQISHTIPTATFNYIPNNEEGQKLVDGMKQYLNKERYTLKDRGQCINREKYSLDEVSTDRGIDKKEYGKYIKVHISEKRRSK